MSEVIAALIGALIAGGWQTVLDFRERRRRHQAIIQAVASEVATLCEFIRIQDYVSDFAKEAAAAANGGDAMMLPIDAGQSYFTMYEAVASDLGGLEGVQAATIVRFYTLCKNAIDTAKPNTSFPPTPQNLRFMSNLSALILKIGDEIVQYAPAAEIEPLR
jgi:hypothetical protein